MKVVHISTSDIGGAGSAALRLHKGLLDQGIKSKFLCFNKFSDEEEVYAFNRKSLLNFFQRRIQNLGIALTSEEINKKILKKYKGEFAMFSFPETDYDIVNDPIVKDADLINLHWIGEFLNYKTFFREVKKPVVWTLHDKNPTLGGFHLLLDKENNPLFYPLENKLANDKHSYVSKISNLDVVSPSKFLLNYSLLSKTLGKFAHHHIPNSINTDYFKIHDQQFARKVFNLPIDRKIVLFLDSSGYHKGTDFVVDCIHENEFVDVQFVALGNCHTASHKAVINLKSINDDRLMAILYSAADLFLLPSREDNLPNMMLESLACGTPVLGFPVGGIPDVIQNGYNGYITKELTSAALNTGINNFLENIMQFDRLKIRESTVRHYDIAIQASAYKALYTSILKDDLRS